MNGSFSFDTIKDFDSHIAQSIPMYSELQKCIMGILEYYIKDGVTIYDIGCSTGKLLKKIDSLYKKNLSLIGYDKALNLLPADSGQCRFYNSDITTNLNVSDSDIVLSIFTLTFIQPKYRLGIVKEIYSRMNKGGILILTEKVYSENSRIQDIYTFLYYEYKRETFKADEILNKEKSLREIQYPYTSNENKKMLSKAGFSVIDTFWKHYNFEGYLCIK